MTVSGRFTVYVSEPDVPTTAKVYEPGSTLEAMATLRVVMLAVAGLGVMPAVTPLVAMVFGTSSAKGDRTGERRGQPAMD